MRKKMSQSFTEEWLRLQTKAATFQTAVFLFVVVVFSADRLFSPELNMREKFQRVFQESLVITFPSFCRRVCLSGGEASESPEENSDEATLFISDDCWSQKPSRLSAGAFLSALQVRQYIRCFKYLKWKPSARANCFILQRPERVGAEYWSIGSHVGTQCFLFY